jgi:uncharacterized protein
MGMVIACRRDVRVGRRQATANARKHHVSFEEAASVFLDPAALTFLDPDHSEHEDREITIGLSARRRVLVVAHTEREGRIRLINARRASRREQEQYEEGFGETT